MAVHIPSKREIHLEAVTVNAPKGLAELIADLGNGENGFTGTPVARGEMSLDDYLRHCMDMTNPAKLQSGYVPQTVFWVIDGAGEAVGIARVRHYLNDRLKDRGGHIGYYIHRDRRGKGYGKETLRLALLELRKLGEEIALLTVDVKNAASIKTIEANGGKFDSLGQDEEGYKFFRYRIELD